MRPGPLHPALHAGDRQTESCRGFDLRHAIEVHQLQCFLICSCQPAHQRLEARTQLARRNLVVLWRVAGSEFVRDVLGRAGRHLPILRWGPVEIRDGASCGLVDPDVQLVGLSQRRQCTMLQLLAVVLGSWGPAVLLVRSQLAVF